MRASDPNKDYRTLIRGNALYELADTEHRRWMAYVRSEGMRLADTDLMDAYYGEVNGRHVDTLGKLTPCLVDTTRQLADVWKAVRKKEPNTYQTKRSFRERDKLLVRSAETIAKIANPTNRPPSEQQPRLSKIRKSLVLNHTAFVYEDVCRERMWKLEEKVQHASWHQEKRTTWFALFGYNGSLTSRVGNARWSGRCVPYEVRSMIGITASHQDMYSVWST